MSDSFKSYRSLWVWVCCPLFLLTFLLPDFLVWSTFSNCNHFPWKFTWEYFEICKNTLTRQDLHLLLSIALEYYLPGITLRWTFLLRCSQTQSTLILMRNLCEFQSMVTNSQGFCCYLIYARPRLRPGNFFFQSPSPGLF